MDHDEWSTRPITEPQTSRTSSARTIHDLEDEREATELGPVEQSLDTGLSTIPHRVQKPPPQWYIVFSSVDRDRVSLNAYYIMRELAKGESLLHTPGRARPDSSLANERTFLAYQRTSLALSMIGVVTAQLFNLQASAASQPALGYFALGKPLGALFQIAAMFVTIVGAHRFWRQQINMARGKVWAGGWEVYAIMVTMFLLVALIFALLITVDVKEEES